MLFIYIYANINYLNASVKNLFFGLPVFFELSKANRFVLYFLRNPLAVRFACRFYMFQ
jgi:hypothetical protein